MSEVWHLALENSKGEMPDKDELRWYGPLPTYPPPGPDAAQINAARRFVSEWLEVNPERFTIPGTEYGKSLLHWLHILVAATQKETN